MHVHQPSFVDRAERKKENHERHCVLYRTLLLGSPVGVFAHHCGACRPALDTELQCRRATW